jgi:hypothetical protein
LIVGNRKWTQKSRRAGRRNITSRVEPAREKSAMLPNMFSVRVQKI